MTVPQLVRTTLSVVRHPAGTRAELKAFQDAQLRRLLVHAYESVPYYRKLFDRHRLHPRHIRGTVDLDLIPISTKSEIQSRPPAQLLMRGVDPVELHSAASSSGGDPFPLYRSWREQGLDLLFRERCWRAFGLRPHERVATLGWMGRLGIHPTLRLDGAEPAEEIAPRLAGFRPHMLVAAPGTLCLLADYLISSGSQEIRPRILVTAGEILAPLMHQRLHHAFGVGPLQIYSSQELPLMAWECRTTGDMHISDDGAIVEVLREGQPATPGQ
ncbi:MAG TPA: hypothetical protein VJ808_00495, partial [Gemmatimonadales bacterium]|nr:hypothetical protein [Gemmatimonadales bacterium]